jgi:putative flippase GtrA
MRDPPRPDDSDAPRGRLLTLKYSAASLCGFATDLTLLKVLTHLGMAPAWARVISLFCAMQVTFCINGFLVFRCIALKRVHRQWGAYMATNALGNLCNYLVFTTLLSLHRPVVSNHTLAVCAGAFIAWVVNYGFTRLIVFNPRLHRWWEAMAGAAGRPPVGRKAPAPRPAG